jgi:alkylation response protein AidB-like acyl-CoA dehydrogenase
MDTFIEKARQLLPLLEKHSVAHDTEGTFVTESFQALKDEKMFGLAVPKELGGGGASYRELCEVIRLLAQGCTSTALAFSMHQHLVATTVWRVKHGQPGEPLLRKVSEQGVVLVSTGASDWLESNGKMEKVDKGFRFSAHKPFASGSPVGDLLVTSGRYEDPKEGTQILHFLLPVRAEGVRSLGDWDTLGMRGTGSNTLQIEGAFIPDEAITMRRPAGAWFPALNVVATVACPIIMSAYVGAAEKVTELALARAKNAANDPDVQSNAGELLNERFAVLALWNALVDNVNDYDFAPDLEHASRALQGKTLVSDAVQRTARKALELGGGGAYFRKSSIERLFRDVHGAMYHPLQPKRQHRFSGRTALGLPPLS